MQIDLSAPYAVAAASLAVTIQGVIIGVAVMIRGTAKDLARESKRREEQAQEANAQPAALTTKDQEKSVALATALTRIEAVERLASSAATLAAEHAVSLAAIESWKPRDERRRCRR